MLYNLKYNDQIHELLRSGEFDDSYVDINEEKLIVNNKICLSEIPDEYEKVKIDGYIEVLQDFYKQQYELKYNEYVVNYQNGVILFNKYQENKRVKIKYKGKGVIQYPAERILVHAPNPWVIDNLQQLIDLIYDKEKELKKEVKQSIEFIRNKTDEYERFVKQFTSMYEKYIDDRTREYKIYIEDLSDKFKRYIDKYIERAEEKIRLMDVHIEICKKQTDECKLTKEETDRIRKLTEKIKDETLLIKQKTEETMGKCTIATVNAIDKTKECIDVTNKSKDELQNLKIDRLNTRLIWLPMVDSYADIDIKYPNPKIGSSVMTKEKGNLYRWDGIKWILWGNVTGAVPLVSEETNGLMPKEDFIKLKNIEEKAQRNWIGESAKLALPEYTRIKTIVFVLRAERIKAGVQPLVIMFPHKGIIKRVYGICQKTAMQHCTIQLEKISQEGYNSNIHNKKEWLQILEQGGEIIFPYGEYKSIQNKILFNKVNENDIFRLNVITPDSTINNITINVDILI